MSDPGVSRIHHEPQPRDRDFELLEPVARAMGVHSDLPGDVSDLVLYLLSASRVGIGESPAWRS